VRTKVLFVMNNLQCGGAEKSLVSLLNTIDHSRFQVDLLLFKREGMFMKQLPPEVKLIDVMPGYQLFDMPISQALRACLRDRQYRIALARIRAGFLFRGNDNAARKEQRLWKHLSLALPNVREPYDAAIGFLEKTPVYFCLDKVEAKVKLGFIHNDYEKLGMDPALDVRYFHKLDYLVTVSDTCSEVLMRLFPEQTGKVKVIQNVVSPALIRALAGQNDSIGALDESITIVSVGRLTAQKGFDLAVHACRLLRDRGYRVQWNVIGEGEERQELERMIERMSLQDHFHLLGPKENPYTFISQADLYVQPSRFEGKAIAIDEAKILGKPIVVTNFSTASDQIRHGHNGWITGMSAIELAEGIAEVLGNEDLKQSFSQRLSEENLGTEAEIEKLYELLT
jgi:glycosyltransferase involved in cell wall biosynthesis